jgi:all-trans-nonaprenyl-diphosphate synthase
LANLDNLAVVKLLSEVIRDFAEGEIRQGLSQFDVDLSITDYLEKSYYKTASLMANSVKAAGVLSGVSSQVCDDLYGYGRNLGLAFQIVDDILDFTATSDVLGKPAGSDLKSGNLTAPVLYALEEKPELKDLIENELSGEGELESAIALIKETKGIDRTRELASYHSQLAVEYLDKAVKESPSAQALRDLADYILRRLY